MSLKMPLILNALLASVGIASSLAFNPAAGFIVLLLVLGIHCRFIRPQEWRLLIQLTVIGWLFDAVLLRMDLLTATGEIQSLSRVMCWPLLASMLCHSLYPFMRHFLLAMVLGVGWGLMLYGLPLALGYYQASIPLMAMLVVVACVSAIIMLLYSFIIRTRIIPQPL